MALNSNAALVRAALDHDLRSNLNIVLGYGAMVKDELVERGLHDIVRDVDYIVSAGRDLLDLNSRIEDLFRLEMGSWRHTPAAISVDELVRRTIAELQEECSRAPVTVSGDAQAKTEDINSLGRVVGSVLKQLSRFVSDEGSVSVEIKESTCSVYVNVCAQMPVDCRHMYLFLERLVSPTQEMSDIKDFDSYYLTTMCRSAKASVCLIENGLSLKIEK